MVVGNDSWVGGPLKFYGPPGGPGLFEAVAVLPPYHSHPTRDSSYSKVVASLVFAFCNALLF